MIGVWERRMVRSLVELADVLVAGADVIEFLQAVTEHCVAALEADGAGVLLADHGGALTVLAASDEGAALHGLLDARDGPARECFQRGAPVRWDPTADSSRFAALAGDAGFGAAYAAPMRLRELTVGVVTVFHRAGSPHGHTGRLTQSFADMASIGIPHVRSREHPDLVAEQVRTVVHERVVVEQAKGVLAERRGIDVVEAFAELRAWARHHRTQVVEVARAVLANGPAVADLVHRRDG
ncbi:GAF and ANTAR domain-containing protein [Saccharothrix mutabilis subsp. mutabilis]|uniref:GAF and ANTAR domain-containing protein n=1 Tax=Saccharothrix mutabilis subsp. mutabilis TaxID=66855 RepID=A0ABN0UUT9_9PSEU